MRPGISPITSAPCQIRRVGYLRTSPSQRHTRGNQNMALDNTTRAPYAILLERPKSFCCSFVPIFAQSGTSTRPASSPRRPPPYTTKSKGFPEDGTPTLTKPFTSWGMARPLHQTDKSHSSTTLAGGYPPQRHRSPASHNLVAALFLPFSSSPFRSPAGSLSISSFPLSPSLSPCSDWTRCRLLAGPSS